MTRYCKMVFAFCVGLGFVACGTSPAPVGKSEANTQRAAAASSATANNSTTSQHSNATPSLQEISRATPLPLSEVKIDPLGSASPATTTQVGPYEHLQKAVALLQVGQEIAAKEHLHAILKVNPNDPIAKNLMMQIDEPASNYFGPKSFQYKTRPGDTLSSISQKFLSDRMKFYGLAKYNNLSDPSRLRVGQTIRIPGESQQRETHTVPDSSEPGNTFSGGTNSERGKVDERIYKQAKRLFDKGAYAETIDFIQDSKIKSDKLKELLLASYAEQTRLYLKKEEFVNARQTIELGMKLNPRDERLHELSAKVALESDSKRHWERANDSIKKGDLSQAYVSLREVLKREPEHTGALTEIKKIKSEVIDGAYKECIFAFQRKEFNEAVKLCDKVLGIEPDHELAKLHRARAEEILDKIKGITPQRN